jgi:hypothetical protein
MAGTIVLESARTHRDAGGRLRPEFRLKRSPMGFWVERRRSAFIVDRVMQVYDRFDTYWTDSVEDAVTRFMRIPGVERPQSGR